MGFARLHRRRRDRTKTGGVSAAALGICLFILPATLHQVALCGTTPTLATIAMATPPVQVGQQDIPANADTSNVDVPIAKVAPAPDVTKAVEPGLAAFDESAPVTQHAESPPDKVIDYLWSVYQRSPLKRDGHGEFTWKDVSAAERLGLSLRDYVIGGMDPKFREQLYYAGLAMDADDVEWTILSGFRDDYRQTIASGFKARPGNSFHGGSIATGGYAHGCAVDVASVDPTASQMVWRWLDLHGSEFGLHRPLARIDPAHVQPLGSWHELAAKLRGEDGRPQPEPVAVRPREGVISVAASNGETTAETHADCTKPRLAVAENGKTDSKDGEPALRPAKWRRVLSLPVPHRSLPQSHLESRWSRAGSKWHLKVTVAADEKPAKRAAAPGKLAKGKAAALDKSLKIAAQEKPLKRSAVTHDRPPGSAAGKKSAPVNPMRRQAMRRLARQQG